MTILYIFKHYFLNGLIHSLLNAHHQTNYSEYNQTSNLSTKELLSTTDQQ